MTTQSSDLCFVLVPGGWHGGWSYDAVSERLRTHGHQVLAVTLAGMELATEGRGSDLGPTPNLDMHIEQVTALIRDRCQARAVLCGHSYAGMVISGVAEQIPEKIAHLVYIDAYVPSNGDSCWTLTSDKFRRIFAAGARHDGRTVAVPPGLDARARPHPLASFLQAARLDRHTTPPPRTFISGGPWSGSPFIDLTRQLRGDPAWQVHEILVGHDIMNRDPEALTSILLDTAGPCRDPTS
jgi:pimeloyl-ACP methyl ester carboxylesterase